jgi:serine/threonine-protein kinase
MDEPRDKGSGRPGRPPDAGATADTTPIEARAVPHSPPFGGHAPARGGDEAIPPEHLFHGKYRVVAKLGQGGFAKVYKAIHIELDEPRVIKLLHYAMGTNEEIITRFKREAVAASRLRHPGVVTVHDIDATTDGHLYIVMEFVDGCTLRQYMMSHPKLDVADTLTIGREIASTLVEAHAHRIIHRDLKPENVLIPTDRREHVKVLDFGLAKIFSEAMGTVSISGMLYGTPRYMSPEQSGALKPGETIDARSDIYSLGLILYEMLAGQPPFEAITPHELMAKHMWEAPPPLEVRRGNLPAPVLALVARALSKDRAQRQPSMEVVTEDIDAALAAVAGTTIVSPAPRGRVRARETPSRGVAVTPATTPAGALAAAGAARLKAARRKAGRDLGRLVRARWFVALVVLALLAVPAWIVLVRSDRGGGKAPAESPTAEVPPSTTPPPATLPPVPESPAAGATGDASAAAVQAPIPAATAAPGTLEVFVEPAADIFIDGAKKPVASLRNHLKTEIAAGAHTIRLRHPAGGDVKQKVTVDAGARVTVRHEFRYGHLRVALSGTPWAHVKVDGRQQKQTAPCIIRDLPVGHHRLTVYRPGVVFADSTMDVDLTEGENLVTFRRAGEGK